MVGYRTAKESWITRLLAEGLEPRVILLETGIPTRQAAARESGWHEGKAGEGRDGAESNCGAEQGQNKATINRMPDPSVRSSLNHTMVLFQRDAAAPVFSQVHAGPNGEAQPCDRERQAGAC